MKEDNKSISPATYYTLAGILLGLVFPFAASIIEINR